MMNVAAITQLNACYPPSSGQGRAVIRTIRRAKIGQAGSRVPIPYLDLKSTIEFSLNCLICLAPRAGFEPATNRLTAGCSTAELPGNSLLARWKSHITKPNPL